MKVCVICLQIRHFYDIIDFVIIKIINERTDYFEYITLQF